MPHYLKNWTFYDVVDFLAQHFFIEIVGNSSGHRFYRGNVDKQVKLVEVQFHGTHAITPRSLQHDIIPKSGIPENYWKNWSLVSGNKKLRKKTQYSGAKPVIF